MRGASDVSVGNCRDLDCHIPLVHLIPYTCPWDICKQPGTFRTFGYLLFQSVL